MPHEQSGLVAFRISIIYVIIPVEIRPVCFLEDKHKLFFHIIQHIETGKHDVFGQFLQHFLPCAVFFYPLNDIAEQGSFVQASAFLLRLFQAGIEFVHVFP